MPASSEEGLIRLHPRRPRWSLGFAQFGVEPLGFVELVLQRDDAAGGIQASAFVDQFPHARGQPELMAE